MTSLVWTMMLLSGYVMHKLYTHVRMASHTKPNLQCSLDPNGVEVIVLIETESQQYLYDASKIWRSFLLGFMRMCCGVIKQ